MTDAANLQYRDRTIKQIAADFNISERMLYEAMRLPRTGRDDLVARVEAGEISIHRALILAGVKKEKIRSRCGITLQQAWTQSTEKQRREFIDWLNALWKEHVASQPAA